MNSREKIIQNRKAPGIEEGGEWQDGKGLLAIRFSFSFPVAVGFFYGLNILKKSQLREEHKHSLQRG